MSEKPIEVGCLVELRHACCGVQAERVGRYGIVDEICVLYSQCSSCRDRTELPVLSARVSDIANTGPALSRGWYPLSWLRRVPDFPEIINEKTDDRVPEYILK